MAKYNVKYRHTNALNPSGWNRGDLNVEANSESEAKAKTVEHINRRDGGNRKVEILSVKKI